jgi:hypothetical protein
LKRILFVFSRQSSFIAIDQAVLEQRWQVHPWQQQGPVVNVFRLVREVARSDLVFGWFASWHTFVPVLLARVMRKPVVMVIGGFDTARLPDIGYGLQGRGAMRRVSRWVMRLATTAARRRPPTRASIPAASRSCTTGCRTRSGSCPPARASGLH